MAPPVSLTRKFSVDNTPKSRVKVKRSQSLIFSDNAAGSLGATPGKTLFRGSCEVLNTSQDSFMDDKNTPSQLKKSNSFLGKKIKLILGKKSNKVGKASGGAEDGDETINDVEQVEVCTQDRSPVDEREGEPESLLPKQAVDSGLSCHPTAVMVDRNKVGITPDYEDNPSNKSSVWYVNNSTSEEEDESHCSNQEDESPDERDNRSSGDMKENKLCWDVSGRERQKDWGEMEGRSDDNGPCTCSTGQLFTISEECVDTDDAAQNSSTDNSEGDTVECSSSYLASTPPLLLRCRMTTSSAVTTNRWSVAESGIHASPRLIEAANNFISLSRLSIPDSTTPYDELDCNKDNDSSEESTIQNSPSNSTDETVTSGNPFGSPNSSDFSENLGMNTSLSMMELPQFTEDETPCPRQAKTLTRNDQDTMKLRALRRSTSLSFSLQGSTENLENFKQRLLRKREQWRERRQSSKSLKDAARKDSKEDQSKESAKPAEENPPSTPDNKLYRWFSLRKSVNYDVERRSNTIANTERTSSYTTTNNGTNATSNNRMPKLLEEADSEHGGLFSENGGVFAHTFQRRHQPPALPPMPQSLSPEQIKRRHIVASIVHSENNYVATLQRLVNDYKKPLEDSKPPVLSTAKLSTLFHRLSEILQCHTLFRIALAECVRQWDREEKIGDVFVASFSKAIVLDIYSDFINNFARAMEVAKQESKKKSAFADFLKMRQITSPDRLSFFGLMVKPVQRFPQFILFLQDLLKHTPQGHHDRMSLQLALTQLESLAEMLNERKREAEQYQAFRDTLKHINTKFALRGIQEGSRYLLRQDDVLQLEFNQSGLISKSKGRRLFLTNDLIICVTVVPKTTDDYGHQNERLSLKWAYPVTDVEIQDTSSSPTLSRLLASGVNKTGSINSARIPEETMGSNVDNLCQEMNDLMHDYEVVSRISTLVSSLRGTYDGLTAEHLQQVSNNIQRALHIRDEQMAWVDACCLQFTAKSKEGREKETFTFQTNNPVIKKDWIVELRLAQLALDSSNSPAWDVPEQEKRPSTKMPLFVKSLPVFSSPHDTEVKCGCCYTVTMSRPSRLSGTGRHHTYLWLCSTDGVSSHITIYLMQQVGLREVVRVDMVEVCVTSLQHVPGITTTDEPSLRAHTVWMGTHSHRLMVYSGLDPERQTELGSTTVPAAITTIKYHCDQVYVGLCNGCVQVYRRGADGAWQLREPLNIILGSQAVSALLPINTHVYAACGDHVHVIDCFTAEVTKKFSVHHDGAGGVQLMAHSGIGLWIAQQNTSTICLYHTETFRHLQDINVASNVNRVLGERGIAASSVNVTALLASRGLLWVGTNVGVALTIPLPRLEGVPIISGRANISYHAHNGPITFLLTLQPHSRPQASLPELRPGSRPSLQDNHSHSQQQESSRTHGSDDIRSLIVTPTPISRLEKQQSDGSLVPPKRVPPRLRQQLSSPVILRRKPRDTQQHMRRLSKTLPRGLGLGTLAGSQECDVYGLYGDLLNVHEYEDEPMVIGEGFLLSRYDSMRRSDPELAVPAQLSTLDRRVRLKASRPRSLDLSTWSMDSRASSACTTSSGSEDGSGGMNSVITSSNASTGQHDSVPLISSTSGGTTSRSTVSGRRKENDQSRTLMTLMGGRGYVNLRQLQDGQPPHTNDKDAHIVVWEMKL
ncbi:rho guanine nucleotide exchange factor 10-like isoform X3 [Homarus americanus]|uniref:rho guanine nucleotide exchange factor 10-like isoform X3 n=1 Tax=Homarus americanus TaxID=6706 RepID=UPI001C44B3ED|nr:rho guanine nucleotide exchange factor 10-like isoform X3 [Homarus americanus]